MAVHSETVTVVLLTRSLPWKLSSPSHSGLMVLQLTLCQPLGLGFFFFGHAGSFPDKAYFPLQLSGGSLWKQETSVSVWWGWEAIILRYYCAIVFAVLAQWWFWQQWRGQRLGGLWNRRICRYVLHRVFCGHSASARAAKLSMKGGQNGGLGGERGGTGLNCKLLLCGWESKIKKGENDWPCDNFFFHAC